MDTKDYGFYQDPLELESIAHRSYIIILKAQRELTLHWENLPNSCDFSFNQMEIDTHGN